MRRLKKYFRQLVRPPMLRLRLRAKGSFKFYGHEVYAPTGSVIFSRWADEGAFEPEVIEAMAALAAPDTWVFDVGANIGLMSIATIYLRPDIRMVSVECSPSTLPFLRKTIAASPFRNRCTLIETAVGKVAGSATFFTSGADLGAYDGLSDTGRGGRTAPVQVQVQPLDDMWIALGRPPVSLIKLDIEGGELDALQGAKELVAACRPIVLLEWHSENLKAYGIDPARLFNICYDGFEVYSLPYLQRVSRSLLPLAMRRSEMFVLVPTGEDN